MDTRREGEPVVKEQSTIGLDLLTAAVISPPSLAIIRYYLNSDLAFLGLKIPDPLSLASSLGRLIQSIS